MKDTDKPVPISFKRLKTTNSDVSGVGKVRAILLMFELCQWH